MNDKVIIAKASDATAERLYRFVKKINDNTSIRAYPNFDNEAVFFPVDKYDMNFIKGVLSEKGFEVKIENAIK